MQAIAFVYGFDQNFGIMVDAILVQSYSVLFLVCLLKKMREEKERKSFNFFYLLVYLVFLFLILRSGLSIELCVRLSRVVFKENRWFLRRFGMQRTHCEKVCIQWIILIEELDRFFLQVQHFVLIYCW